MKLSTIKPLSGQGLMQKSAQTSSRRQSSLAREEKGNIVTDLRKVNALLADALKGEVGDPMNQAILEGQIIPYLAEAIGEKKFYAANNRLLTSEIVEEGLMDLATERETQYAFLLESSPDIVTWLRDIFKIPK